MPVSKFLGDLARAARSGVIQRETEQHIRYSFCTIGRTGDLPACARVVDDVKLTRFGGALQAFTGGT